MGKATIEMTLLPVTGLQGKDVYVAYNSDMCLQCGFAKLQRLVYMLYAYLSTHVYAMYRLCMVMLAEVRRMCDMQDSICICLHIDIRSIIQI